MTPAGDQMRVLYFVSLFPCWSETFIVREIRELLELGVDVRIVSLKHPREALVQADSHALINRVTYPMRWQTAFVRVLRQVVRHPLLEAGALLSLTRHFLRTPTALAKSLVVWWRTLALLPSIRAMAPDHLHAHWATYPSTAAMLASRRLGVAFSFTAHAHDIFLEDHLLAAKMRQAAFGVTISDFNRRFLTERVSPIAHECMRVVHCGVAPAAYEYQPAGREADLIVAVGRLDAIKGFEFLVDACAILARHGQGFSCRILGEGPLRDGLQRRIDDAGLRHCVLLVGAQPQEQVRRDLLRATVFVLPSVVTPRGDRDGIPVSLMEAMAVGVPVVSTRVSGIPELVVDGVTGLVVEPGDAAALAQAMARALCEPTALLPMVREARRRVESDFDVSKEARKLHDAILRSRIGRCAPAPVGTSARSPAA